MPRNDNDKTATGDRDGKDMRVLRSAVEGPQAHRAPVSGRTPGAVQVILHGARLRASARHGDVHAVRARSGQTPWWQESDDG